MRTPGLNHVILTISNLERSRAFYGDVLGFHLVDVADDPNRGFYFETGGVSCWFFPSAHPVEGDRFSEFRIGLDHLGFTAPDEPSLRELATTLVAAGVATKGVERFFTGNLYVAFRDPDNIQLEYWLPT